MSSRLAWAGACLLAVNALGTTNNLADAEGEGRRLAQELRELRPTENFTNTGLLKIFKSRRGRPIEIAVRCETVVTATNWTVAYSTHGTNKDNAASFAVIHTDNQPNEYRVRNFAPASNQTNEFTTLTGGEVMIPFAGSDFWLVELGLEFFHWPGQRLLKKEIKSGQSCSVLESTNPSATNGYVRVVSWIDIDTGGIVQADAYDSKGKYLKEFVVKGVKKVKGQWQVEELRINNVQSHSHTQLEFHFDSNPP